MPIKTSLLCWELIFEQELSCHHSTTNKMLKDDDENHNSTLSKLVPQIWNLLLKIVRIRCVHIQIDLPFWQTHSQRFGSTCTSPGHWWDCKLWAPKEIPKIPPSGGIIDPDKGVFYLQNILLKLRPCNLFWPAKRAFWKGCRRKCLGTPIAGWV